MPENSDHPTHRSHPDVEASRPAPRSRRGLALSALALIVVAVGVGPAHAAPAGFSTVDDTTLTSVDVPPTGTSAGDGSIFASTVTENGTTIGTNRGFCLTVDTAAGLVSCNWTVTLTGAGGHTAGSIVMLGTASTTADSTLAVIGGTGGYQGAQGQAVLHPVDAAHFAFTYAFV